MTTYLMLNSLAAQVTTLIAEKVVICSLLAKKELFLNWEADVGVSHSDCGLTPLNSNRACGLIGVLRVGGNITFCLEDRCCLWNLDDFKFATTLQPMATIFKVD